MILHYKCIFSVLKCYNYPNWTSNRRNSKYISGWLFTIGGAIVAWFFKRNNIVLHYLPWNLSLLFCLLLVKIFYRLRDLGGAFYLLLFLKDLLFYIMIIKLQFTII